MLPLLHQLMEPNRTSRRRNKAFEFWDHLPLFITNSDSVLNSNSLTLNFHKFSLEIKINMLIDI